MYELVRLTENNYYIESPAKVGIITTGNDAYIIDSGNNKDAGKRIKKILDANGWTLRAVFNTHAHADHIGGNCYLQNNTDCKIYAPGIECDLTRHTILTPSLIYGGFAPSELRHKFLLAQESDAAELSGEVLPDGVEPLPLPGHTFDMTGFRTSEGVVYLGDCLSSEETLDKYKICVILDIAAYLDTLETVKEMDAAWFVPSHAAATQEIKPLAQLNIDRVYENADIITAICRDEHSFDEILREVFTRLSLTMTHEQHALVGTTVKSYLTWLKEKGELCSYIDDNRLLWKARG